jgi:hypothetical protein
MSYRLWLALAVGLFAAGALGSGAAPAQTLRMQEYETAGAASIITLDARPLTAEVRLDGVLIGTARDVLARSVPLAVGRHTLHISAPGYKPAVVTVSATPDWAKRIFVELVPDRQP